MQDTLKQPLNTTTGRENLCLTSEEVATLRHALKATQHLLIIPPAEWNQVFWKISLAMTQYLAECPVPALIDQYIVCMELLSDFMAQLQALYQPSLDALICKIA